MLINNNTPTDDDGFVCLNCYTRFKKPVCEDGEQVCIDCYHSNFIPIPQLEEINKDVDKGIEKRRLRRSRQ
jgi:hypothetical protein